MGVNLVHFKLLPIGAESCSGPDRPLQRRAGARLHPYKLIWK